MNAIDWRRPSYRKAARRRGSPMRCDLCGATIEQGDRYHRGPRTQKGAHEECRTKLIESKGELPAQPGAPSKGEPARPAVGTSHQRTMLRRRVLALAIEARNGITAIGAVDRLSVSFDAATEAIRYLEKIGYIKRTVTRYHPTDDGRLVHRSRRQPGETGGVGTPASSGPRPLKQGNAAGGLVHPRGAGTPDKRTDDERPTPQEAEPMPKRGEQRRAICQYIENRPGCTAKDVHAATGVGRRSPSTTSAKLCNLRHAGRIRSEGPRPLRWFMVDAKPEPVPQAPPPVRSPTVTPAAPVQERTENEPPESEWAENGSVLGMLDTTIRSVPPLPAPSAPVVELVAEMQPPTPEEAHRAALVEEQLASLWKVRAALTVDLAMANAIIGALESL